MYMFIQFNLYKEENIVYINMEQQQMWPRNVHYQMRVLAGNWGTDKPEVKYTPQHRCKERLEDKMIEFIDLTTKQTAAELVPHATPPTKDYVGTQLEAMGQAIRSSLDPRQQFECLFEMNNVLYRHVRQPQFPLPNQQNYGGAVDTGVDQQGQGPMMRELNFQTL